MRTDRALARGLARVGQLWNDGRYADAFQEVERLLGLSPANPRLLVMRAQLAQLQDFQGQSDSPTLDEVGADLKRAARLDESSPVPLIELGYFHYAVRDDPKSASRYFRRAIQQCRDLLCEALHGQAKALAEQDRVAEAFDCLARAHALRHHDGKATEEDVIAQLRMILSDQ